MSRGSSFLRYLLVGLDATALTLSWLTAIALVPNSGRSTALDILSTVAFATGGARHL